MSDKISPFQLKMGSQSVLLSDLLNAELLSVSFNDSQKITRFLNVLGADILCMRADVETRVIITCSDNTFSIKLDDHYPFLDFLSEIYFYKFTTKDTNPVVFSLNLSTPLEMINSYLIAITLNDLHKKGIYKLNDADIHNSMEPYIHIDALHVFYIFDVIDRSLGYNGKLLTLIKNRVYNIYNYTEEDEFSIFELRDFNSSHISITLSNHEFFIQVEKDSIKFEYLYDSMNFALNQKHSMDVNIEKFTKFFLSFYNLQHDTSHDDLPRWITLQEMIAI
jgi:hypothetical protein